MPSGRLPRASLSGLPRAKSRHACHDAERCPGIGGRHISPGSLSDIPSYLERAAMAAIRGDPHYHASPATILNLLRKGWIEKKVGKAYVNMGSLPRAKWR
jgi:hypothetical protein